LAPPVTKLSIIIIFFWEGGFKTEETIEANELIKTSQRRATHVGVITRHNTTFKEKGNRESKE
jgi:hypothetical protein